MEDKLRAIVTRIENSKIPDSDKEDLYATISTGLQATVWPVLIKYMPKEQLKDLSDNPAKVTVETYAKLIEDTVKDGKAFAEVAKYMDQVLGEVEKVLTEEGI
ncbi:hypothetical protein A2Z33_03540 [Candidatus Gottesmanbacteria bacterium RBG_16_52_11]|uniref:Uncharacterized protein n=1 Tax=Candidatus Gottesmanbacteria bacterium RBG_16_52_11 TaxID=1798374 RepID=A0A1F5YVG2_9BACT|nr:MAG: hypothetical protein A2Z33_03540 [Candidatus Gottesmanbacteria bacterium RBG_16_52_11]